MPTRAEYAKMNIGCKALGIDRHQLQRDLFGVESAKDLTPFQVRKMLARLNDLGWKPKRGGARKSSPKYKDAQKRKIVGLWVNLHRAGVVRNGSDFSLQRYIKRMTGKDNLAWCDNDDVGLVCQALVEWCKRERVDGV